MKTKILGVLIIGFLILTACTTNQTSTPDAATVQTMVAQTLSVISTSMVETQQATPILPTTIAPTEPLFPTLTFTPSPQPTATNTATAIPTATQNQSSCNKAAFVADVTIPDRTPYYAGASFTKTWRLSNAGTCTWDSSYRVVFVNGDAMGAPASATLNKTVAPGQTVDISVTMTAPSAVREYAGYWMLQSGNGGLFGIGADGTGKFYVDIKVIAGTPTATKTPGTGTPTATLAYFAVRNVVITASPATYSGVCPKTINVTGNITVNKAGTVKYHFVRSDGTKSEVKTLTFTGAGSKAISDSYQASTTGYDTVYIDEPNHQTLGHASFTISCSVPTATSTPTTPPTSAPTTPPTSTETPIPPTPTDTDTPEPTATE